MNSKYFNNFKRAGPPYVEIIKYHLPNIPSLGSTLAPLNSYSLFRNKIIFNPWLPSWTHIADCQKFLFFNCRIIYVVKEFYLFLLYIED